MSCLWSSFRLSIIDVTVEPVKPLWLLPDSPQPSTLYMPAVYAVPPSVIPSVLLLSRQASLLPRFPFLGRIPLSRCLSSDPLLHTHWSPNLMKRGFLCYHSHWQQLQRQYPSRTLLYAAFPMPLIPLTAPTNPRWILSLISPVLRLRPYMT